MYSKRGAGRSPAPRESIQKPEIETVSKYENSEQDTKDLSEDRIITCDSRDYETDLLHVDYEAIALENQFKKVIDNEYYTFVGDTNTVVRSDDEEAQSKVEEHVQENKSYFENNENENVIVCEIVKTKTNIDTAKIDTANSVKEHAKIRNSFDTNNKKGDLDIESTVENKEVISQHCMFCQKSFQNSRNLNRHVRIHRGDVPFECKICNKRFKQKSDLNMHERIHTGEEPFECKTCSKRFYQKGDLRRHERIHTGEMPFECKICKKRFNQPTNFKNHERIHSGEVPYMCKTCNKRFKRKEHMKIHERIHTGEQPFECKICKRRFTQINSLKRHEILHTHT